MVFEIVLVVLGAMILWYLLNRQTNRAEVTFSKRMALAGLACDMAMVRDCEKALRAKAHWKAIGLDVPEGHVLLRQNVIGLFELDFDDPIETLTNAKILKQTFGE